MADTTRAGGAGEDGGGAGARGRGVRVDGTFGLYKVASLSAFDTVVTDSGLAAAAADGIRAEGTDLRIAEPSPDARHGTGPALP